MIKTWICVWIIPYLDHSMVGLSLKEKGGGNGGGRSIVRAFGWSEKMKAYMPYSFFNLLLLFSTKEVKQKKVGEKG